MRDSDCDTRWRLQNAIQNIENCDEQQSYLFLVFCSSIDENAIAAAMDDGPSDLGRAFSGFSLRRVPDCNSGLVALTRLKYICLYTTDFSPTYSSTRNENCSGEFSQSLQSSWTTRTPNTCMCEYLWTMSDSADQKSARNFGHSYVCRQRY